MVLGLTGERAKAKGLDFRNLYGNRYVAREGAESL